MAINFSGIVGNLQSLGFYDFALPWLLFFAVILGLLNVSGIFGDKAQRINAIIAAVIAFFISAFTPAGTSLAGYLVPLFGVGGMFAGVLLLLVVMASTLGFEMKDLKEKSFGSWSIPIVAIAILLLAAVAFSTATGNRTGLSIPGIDSDTATIILVVVFVLLVVWMAESGGKAEGTADKEQPVASGGHGHGG